MEKVSVKLIIDTMAKWVEERRPISPSQWLDAGLKLNLLRGELDDMLYTLEHNLSVEKADLMTAQDMTVAKVEVLIKAKPEYKEMRILQAKIKQLEEFVRLAKKRASLKEEEYINSKYN